ncbi:MAG: type I-C CRISPR-associated protein Cas8c/Csd1, partial [Chlorobiaceae bacterium]
MILQALYDYYQRKAADPESNIAPEGFEWKEIPFVIVIDKEGYFVAFEDTREGDGKKKKAKPFLVPAAEKKTVGVKANLLWDNIEYALGANPRERDDIDNRKSAFINRLKETFTDDASASLIAPLVVFLQNDPVTQITDKETENELWKEIFENNSNVIFRVLGSQDSTLCDTMNPYMLKNNTLEDDGICLISGLRAPIARLNASIKGVRGAQSSGAALVSFNLKAFESYGKSQNYNAPMGEPAAFAYTTVLNMLLGKDSKNKVQVGDTTTVFWAQKPTVFEDIFSSFFSFPPKDEPDTDVRAVKALYDEVFTGHTGSDSQTRFYVLGLAPNAARLSVRFWQEGVVQDFAEKIRQHFDDLKIIRSPKDTGRYALFWILSAMALEN